MPKKPKGYGKRGRPSYKKVKQMKFIKALLETNSLKEAYLATHDKSSPTSARKNANRILTDEVVNDVKRLLQIDMLASTNRENLEKLFYTVIGLFFQGDKRVKTSDYIRALENLKELVDDFKKKYEIDDLSHKSEEEIDEELKRKGIDPKQLRFDNGLHSN